jgi:hypothetical protein
MFRKLLVLVFAAMTLATAANAQSPLLGGGTILGAPISGNALSTSGGTLSGPLTLAADPTVALQAATKQYVDAAKAADLPLTGGALNGQLTAPQISTVFYVDRAPSTCTVNSINYTTQINCAFATAGNWVTTNGQNAMLAISQGVWQNCQAIQLPNPTSNGSLSVVGLAYGSTAATGVVIQQSKTAGCNTTLPVISQAQNTNTSTLFEQSIKGITIDGNSVVQCADLVGSRRSEYDMNCNNPAGDHGFLISGTTGTLGFEMRKTRLFVRTAAYGGAVTYAYATAQITGGQVTGWTINNGGGSYPSFWPLTAYVYGQCTTLPSNPTIQTSVANNIATVTGLTNGASAGTGCTAVYAQIFETPQVTHCIVINTTDSTYQDLICGGATSGSGIQINHGANLIEHAHAYAHNPVQVEDHGNNVYTYLECDSPGGVCLVLQGSHTLIFGMTNFWNAQVYPGAGDIYLFGSQTGNAIFGHVCSGSQTAGGYVEIMTPGGPVVPGSNVAPSGLEIIGPNQLCDGSNGYGANYITGEPTLYGSLTSLSKIQTANDSASPQMQIGSGANVPNALGVSGGRVQVGYDSLTAGFVQASGGHPLWFSGSGNVNAVADGTYFGFGGNKQFGNSDPAYFDMKGDLTGTSVKLNPLTVPSSAPTIANVGTAGTTSYSYVCTALDNAGGETGGSTAGTTATGNAPLSGTNYNTITCNGVPANASGVSIYRTAGGSNQGRIFTNVAVASTQNDIGITAGAALSSSNTTGAIQAGSLTTIGYPVGCSTTPCTVGFNVQTGLTTTLANTPFYTAPAKAGYYQVCAMIFVNSTTETAGSLTLTYTDSLNPNGVSESHTLIGATSATVAGGVNQGCAGDIYAGAGAVFSYNTTLSGVTGGAMTYQVEASVRLVHY